MAIDFEPPAATRRTTNLLVASAASGALLFVANRFSDLAFLQLVAFLPFLTARGARRFRDAAAAGLLLGVARLAPHGGVLAAVDPVGWIIVPAYLALLYAGFGVAVLAAERSAPRLLRPLAIGAAFAALELLDAQLPMWGAALALATAWADHSWAIRSIAFTGTAGWAFFVVTSQALVASWFSDRARASAGALVGLIAAYAALSRPPPATPGTLRVAAIGWAGAAGPGDYEPLVADAAGRGARLVVLPEAAVVVPRGGRTAFDRRYGDMARRFGVHLAVGVIDRSHDVDPAADVNRLIFFGPGGEIEGHYDKTHLVPMAESTRAGDGTVAVIDVDGVKVGAMICMDDNFADVTRRYARAGVDVVVVPTFEMSPEMAVLHLRSMRLRALEGGFGMVRAVARGTSAIIGRDAELISVHDHATKGNAAVVADVPVARPDG